MSVDSNKSQGFDLIVIGAGSAGISAAIQASDLGARTLLIEAGLIGGVSLNSGCVPSKTMIRAVEGLHSSKYASRFKGIKIIEKLNNWQEVVNGKQELVDKLRKARYTDVLNSYKNITYLEGEAKLIKNGVRVQEKAYIAKKIIIATGSSPSIPNIDGLNEVPYLTSTTALELKKLPKSLLIIGGGTIGVELGQMFSRVGVSVAICCRSRLLAASELEISSSLEKCLQEEGIRIYKDISYQRIETTKNGIRVMHENGTIEASELLMATGRIPNTNDMDIEKFDVTLVNNKWIKVNEYMQTSNPNIYAVGDVTGLDMFVYMGAYGGKLAAINAIKGNKEQYNNSILPSVVFSDPQVASVGLTEGQAKEQGYDVKTSIVNMNRIARFLVARDDRGLIKLVADKKTDKLLGAHIMAPEAGDLIQTAAIALKAGFTTQDLAECIFPYLTGVEGIRLAAQAFKQDINKLSSCAG